MGTIGLVGLPGSGKTLNLTARTLSALADEMDVYANFALGSRERGYLVPACSSFPDRDVLCWDVAPWRSFRPHALHEQTARAFFVRSSALGPADSERYASAGFRIGEAFVPDPRVFRLRRWEQVIAIRVARDQLGTPHRLELAKVGEHRDREGEVVEEWEAQSRCWTWRCRGCSNGTFVAIDELNLWAPSRYWQKLGIGVADRWAQQRKDSMDIVWTAQHENRIDTIAKEVTQHIWYCRRMGGKASFKWRGRWIGLGMIAVFHRTRFRPELLTDSKRVTIGEGATTGNMSGVLDAEATWWIDVLGLNQKRLADAYDTWEHVEREVNLDASFRAVKAGSPADAGGPPRGARGSRAS